MTEPMTMEQFSQWRADSIGDVQPYDCYLRGIEDARLAQQAQAVELQQHREALARLTTRLIGLGVFNIVHEGGTDAAWKNIEASITQPMQTMDADSLAQEIRRVDGNHSLGAGLLAEALMPFITRALSGEKAGPVDVRNYVGVAEVIGGYEIGDAGAESRVHWLYNPMPEGTILYEEIIPASTTPDKE